MGYPPEIAASARRAAATRARRLHEKIPFLTPEQKNDLLQAHHPDFNPDANAVLRVGRNEGSKVPRELHRVLEAPSRLPRDLDVTKPDQETDVLVIGGGGAGCAAALTAREHGARVLMATKLRLGDSNTIMAEGGIAAATLPHDSPVVHFVDTLRGGRYQNSRELVRVLVTTAPHIVRWLEDLGVMFDRNPDETIVTHAPAGHNRPRSHSCQDLTGLEIMRVLRDEVGNQPIGLLEFAPAVELLLDGDGRCVGAVLWHFDTKRYVVVHAKTVILATGGMGRLHMQGFPTSNHYGATGDGLVLAYRAGASLVDLDAVQYHPTGLVFPEQALGLLVTEAMRARGAHLVNVHGERFLNELETRDTVAAAILRECNERGNGVHTPGGSVGVWLDTPVIDLVHGDGHFRSMFAGLYGRFREQGVDISQEPILVYPTQHYQNGGVTIDENGQTEIPGLYAAGEVAGGVHGRNRLGANSLVDVLVFGRRTGEHAAQQAQQAQPGTAAIHHVAVFDDALQAAGAPEQAPSPVLLPNYARQQGESALTSRLGAAAAGATVARGGE